MSDAVNPTDPLDNKSALEEIKESQENPSAPDAENTNENEIENENENENTNGNSNENINENAEESSKEESKYENINII